MTRGMTPAYQAALAEQVIRPALFVEGEFPSGTLRLWTGLGDVDWNGSTWTGAGNLLGISPLEETADVVATGMQITLSGVPTSLVSLAISDAQQGQPVRLWLALLDDTGAIIADPVQAFTGRLDVPTLEDGAETCTITISYESRLIDLNRTREWRYTDQSQRQLYPGDRGFSFVTSLQDKPIRWGA